MYKLPGYSILAITDHERPCDHSALSESDILMITGYEGYIRPSPTRAYDVFKPEVYFGSKVPRRLRCLPGETVNSADLEIHPESRYIRVSIVDHQRRWADTRAFTRAELGLSPLEAQDDGG